uniref:Uncharacterized protein n=1 Tax=Arundo donax TaxID=35708 RepID=A0A0A9C522_ARUDO
MYMLRNYRYLTYMGTLRHSRAIEASRDKRRQVPIGTTQVDKPGTLIRVESDETRSLGGEIHKEGNPNNRRTHGSFHKEPI